MSPFRRIFFFPLFLPFSFYWHILFPRFPTCEQQREFDRIANSSSATIHLFFMLRWVLALIRQVLSFFFFWSLNTCGWIDKRCEPEVWNKINKRLWRIYFLKYYFEILDFMNMDIILLCQLRDLLIDPYKIFQALLI